jgi:hypothetical protein
LPACLSCLPASEREGMTPLPDLDELTDELLKVAQKSLQELRKEVVKMRKEMVDVRNQMI